MSQADRRKFCRYPVFVPCTVVASREGRVAERESAYMLDVCQGGVLLRVDLPISVGQPVLVGVPWDPWFSIGGRVVRTRPDDDAGHLVGLELVEDWPYAMFARIAFAKRADAADIADEDPLAMYFR